MKADPLYQISRDSDVGAHVRGTHIAVFDITGELPKLLKAGYAVRVRDKKSIVWLQDDKPIRDVRYCFSKVDRNGIKQSMLVNDHGVIEEMVREPLDGHDYFVTWYKHLLMSEKARKFDVSVPTFKHRVDEEYFHPLLHMVALPMYRIITAAIATNVLKYQDRGYDKQDCINLFFRRFPSLEKHRLRVERNLDGGWLEQRISHVRVGIINFNVNQLTGR